MSLPQRTPLVVATLLLATLTSGCLAQRRQAYVEQKASEHLYSQPLARVWPHALALLAEKNFTHRTTGQEYELLTEWLQTSPTSGLGTTYSRYLVRGRVHPGGRCSVEFYRQDRTDTVSASPLGGTVGPDGPGAVTRKLPGDSLDTTMTGGGVEAASNAGSRDGLIEWELLQRVEPEAAKALQSEAEQEIQ